MPEGFPFGAPFGGEEGEPSVPQRPQGQGSGFIFDMDGHIVTNNHVVEDAESVVVYFDNGMWADAEVVATDPQADLAVLKVDPPEGVEWKPLPLASPDDLLPGYYVIAVGQPVWPGRDHDAGRDQRPGSQSPDRRRGWAVPDTLCLT